MKDSFNTTVDQLEQQVHDIGYEDTDIRQLPSPETEPESDGDDDSGNGTLERCVILIDTAAGPEFVLFVSEDQRYVEVQSSYALWQDIAEAISEERAEELAPDTLVNNVPDDHPIRSMLPPDLINNNEGIRGPIAALELLEEASSEVRKEIVYQLSEIFTSAEVKHVVDSPSDTGAPHGFNVYYKIFPYEDDFSIRELNEVIERVRMAAHRGTLFLRYAFNLGVDISRTTAGDIEEEPVPPTNGIDPDVVTEARIEDTSE